MTDSLILNGLELLGAVTNPEYRLGLGLDLGAPEPDTATIQQLLLDGERVSGRRTHNRAINLSVQVFANLPSSATTAQVRSALSTYCDTILAALDDDSFTLLWTPDGGLTEAFDCYRGRGQRQRTIVGDNQGVTLVTLAFSAAPFGRSINPQTITSGGTSITVDALDAAVTGATLDTSVFAQGTGSAKVAWGAGVKTKTVSHAISSTNLSAMTSVSILAVHDSIDSTITATLTLTDGSGGSSTATATGPFPAGTATVPTGVDFRRVYFDLAHAVGTVNLAAVTGWSITMTRTLTGYSSTLPAESTWLDDLRGYPTGSALTSTTNGRVDLLPGVLGSARAPGQFTLAQASSSMLNALLHRPPVDQETAARILIGLNSTLATQTVTVAAPNAAWNGTYILALAVKANASAGVAQTVQIGFTETWGTAVSVALSEVQYSYNYVSTTTNRLLLLGEVTLPIRKVASPTHLASAVRVTNSVGGDRYFDLMLLDTRGQTAILMDTPDPSLMFKFVRVDTPAAGRELGPVLGLYNDPVSPPPWDDAISVLDHSIVIGGPMLLEPGANKMLSYSTAGAPTLTATLYPRWLDERTV